MRTTLDIDEDVLLAAKAEARHRRQTIGAVVSRFARQGLQRPANPGPAVKSTTAQKLAKLGIQVLSFERGVVVTNELVNRIRDEEGI